jgi:hypothetical protein
MRSRLGNRACLLIQLVAVASSVALSQVPAPRNATESPLEPKPALSSVLNTFAKYEVVGIDAGHDQKDIDDFILNLIREPSFPNRVNDIAVECGNSLYQPVLDRYIAGEQVPYSEVQKVWRNTTQIMCGQSAFYEQLFPLVRAINQALPASQRIRVLAADPPIDWSLIHDQKDFSSFTDRDGSIASVMEKEVLSRHRKALMLFGIFHLLHGSGPDEGDAVTLYERRYRQSTFVISGLGYFGTDPNDAFVIPFYKWPNPSFISTQGTSLGSRKLDSFLPTPISTDDQCNVIDSFKARPNLVVSDLIDAFLYLGPQTLHLKEVVPADAALDVAYTSELIRRNTIIGLPGPQTVAEFNKQIITNASFPILTIERLPDAKEFYPMIRQLCLARTKKPDVKAPNQ